MMEGGNIFICFTLAFNQKQVVLFCFFGPPLPPINRNEKKRVFFLYIGFFPKLLYYYVFILNIWRLLYF